MNRTASAEFETPLSGSRPLRGTSAIRSALGSLWSSRDVRRGAISVFDQALVSGTSFVTSVAIGRACLPEDLGIYYLALCIMLFARDTQGQLISTPYMIYGNRRQGEALQRYSGSTLVHQLVYSGAFVVGLLGLLCVLSLGVGPARLAPTIWVLICLAPFLLLREYIRFFAFAHLRMATAVAIDAAVAAIQLGSLLLLAYFGRVTVEAVYAAMGLGCAAACLGWFVCKTQPLRFRWVDVMADWKHNWTFGKWMAATQMVGSATPYLMPWLLFSLHDEAATGLFAACSALVGLASTLVIGTSNFLIPRASQALVQHGPAALRRVLWQTVFAFLAALGAFCLAAVWAGGWLAALIYGPAFAGAGQVVFVLALSVLIHSFGNVAGIGLLALERPRANLAGDAWTLVATFAVAAVLVSPLGVLGAAVSILAGNVAGTIARVISLHHHLDPTPLQASPA